MTQNGAATPSGSVEISVVVGSVESGRSIRDCLQSIYTSARGRSVELIVVDASRDNTAAMIRLRFPDATLVPMPPGTLTPRLWLEGLRRASGAVVAFTTGHCTVPASWLTDLESAVSAGAAGAGGPIALDPKTSFLDAAIYFLRYSSFMAATSTDASLVADIAGDNSMYVRSEILGYLPPGTDGFWEVEVNRGLREDGRILTMVPQAAISFGRSFPLRVISRHRFAHGVHSGNWRSLRLGLNPWRIMLGAPAVPFVLLIRIFNRVRESGGDVGLVIKSSPWILWLATCWAAGEAVGARRALDARRN